MATSRYIFEVEKGKQGVHGASPSVGPVYRSIYAKGGFPEPADDLVSAWDIFRLDISLITISSLKGTTTKVSLTFCSSFYFLFCLLHIVILLV